eukprot:jgi/Chlat1/2191/Chrsp17S02755
MDAVRHAAETAYQAAGAVKDAIKSPTEHPMSKNIIYVSKDEADAAGFGIELPMTPLKEILFKHPPLGDGDLRIDITHSGICHTDIHFAKQDWPVPHMWPIVPGHEIIGVVRAKGSKVGNEFQIGERVGFGPHRNCCGECEYCQAGDDHLCLKVEIEQGNPGMKLIYDPAFGGYATQMQAPAYYAFKIPDKIPSSQASVLLCAGVTTYNAVSRFASKGGMKVAVASIGGLGHLAVQFAKAFGNEVTAITGHPEEKGEEIQNVGADHVIDANDKNAVKQHSWAFDVIVNCNPRWRDYDQLLWMLKPRGKLCQIGISKQQQALNITEFNLCYYERQIIGIWVGSRKQTRDMLEFSAQHNVVPLIDEEMPLDRVNDGIAKVSNSQAKFRIVLRPDQYARARGLPTVNESPAGAV